MGTEGSDSDDDFDACVARWKDNLKEPFCFDDMLKELESHPAFMQKLPDDGNVSDEVLALQSLKYDEDESAEEQALCLKKDGNKWFELNEYGRAIRDYTEALKKQCKDNHLNSVLYNNRAAANFRLGNIRSALQDCLLARKFCPTYWKAVHRGVLCLVRLRQPAKAMEWLSEYESNSAGALPQDFNSVRSKVAKELHHFEEQQKIADRCLQENNAYKRRLLASFKERKLKFAQSDVYTDCFDLSTFEVNLHGANSQVHFSEEGALIWPALIKYPEHETEDFICNFHECNTFAEELEETLPCNKDEHRTQAHNLQDIQVLDVPISPHWSVTFQLYYLSNNNENAYRPLPITFTLLDAIRQEDYWIDHGLPTFYCLNDSSPFTQKFLAGKVVIPLK